jgi:hypothetical protein
VIDQRYSRRRALLDGRALNGPAWCTAPVPNGRIVDVLAACGEHGLESIVAKRVESPYRPGERSPGWIKLKTTTWKSLAPDTTPRALSVGRPALPDVLHDTADAAVEPLARIDGPGACVSAEVERGDAAAQASTDVDVTIGDGR